MAGQHWRHWVAAVSVVAALVLVTATLSALWGYAGRDRPELIDQPLLARTSNAACLMMRNTVHKLAVPPEAPIPDRVGAMRAQNAAVTLMIGQIRRVGPDLVAGDAPATSWLADWELLVRVREDYATALAAGRQKQLRLPTDSDGNLITARMNDVGLDCTVPMELTASG